MFRSGKLSYKNEVPAVDILQLSHKLANLRPNLTVFYGKSEYFDALWRELTGYQSNTRNQTVWISTGFYAYVIAINICDRTKIYGIVPGTSMWPMIISGLSSFETDRKI